MFRYIQILTNLRHVLLDGENIILLKVQEDMISIVVKFTLLQLGPPCQQLGCSTLYVLNACGISLYVLFLIFCKRILH